MNSIIAESNFVTSGLLWLARALSILSIGTLSLFIVGEGFNPFAFSRAELLLAVFFPIGVIVGMVVAWWIEGLGGLITIFSVCGFYLAHFIENGRWPRGLAFFIFALPGALFLAYWLIKQTVHH
jgi:hypothetical protein